jgi:ATP-dependent DNA helicase PIF1
MEYNHCIFKSSKRIVLSVASSGIASLLLSKGQTTHSRFKIPTDLDDTYVCDIRKGTMLVELIHISSLIIWDEALMTNRIAFKALDRTLQDLLFTDSPQNKNKPFGGKVVVLGGDFRQILHVIEGGARSQIVNVAIINSPLWSYVTILQLTQNMRLSTPNVTKEEKK